MSKDLRDALRPAKPTLTEENLPDQSGKVFIVTGGSGGVGKELVGILYQANARVYILARSESKTEAAMLDIRTAHPKSKGQMVYIPLQLEDLTTIKASAEKFLSLENRLDVLFNNAGVMIPPQGSTTVQGFELQLGVNVLGHWLFAYFLRDILAQTAKTTPRGSVRVVWVSSGAIEAASKPAIDFDNMDYHKDESAWSKYGRSKAGNVLHCTEYARQVAGDGIISMTLHPGLLRTDLQRSMPKIQAAIFKLLAAPAKHGAYTELFAGLSTAVTEKNNGWWVAPYGRLEPVRKDLQDPELAAKYWKWCEEQTRPYM